MLILPLALAVGSLVGWAIGGSWRTLSSMQFRRPTLVLGAIAAQLALELPGLDSWPADFRFAIIVVTYLVAGWWLFENARTSSGAARTGIGLLSLGGFLNFLVIALNGGMPVSKSALGRAGIASSVSVIQGHLSKHVLANQTTVLRVLGDVVPLPWLRSVISPGDILMAIGIGAVVAATMRRPALGDGSAAAAATAEQTLVGGHS